MKNKILIMLIWVIKQFKPNIQNLLHQLDINDVFIISPVLRIYITAAQNITTQIETAYPTQSYEYKHHQIFASMIRKFTDVSGADINLAIVLGANKEKL